MTLQGKTAIVTGAGKNIGRVISLTLAKHGADIAICARSRADIDSVAEEIREAGGNALPCVCDISDPAQVNALVSKTLERFGKIDILVNNAACASGHHPHAMGPIAEVDMTAWKRVIDVNVCGTMSCIVAVAPSMIAAGSGHIVNMSGGGGAKPDPNAQHHAYGVSKAALIRLTEIVGMQLGPLGIRVNAVEPGGVGNEKIRAEMAEFEMRAGIPHPRRKFAREPEEAADLIAWLVTDESAPLNGRVVSVADDREALKAQINEIMSSEARTLRMRKE
jgi:NAD(P)-dependent dehydrogenase (short-subunit alcohol dehydrogenase family)